MYILQHMYQYLKTDNNIQMILPASHLTSNVSERCDIKDLLEKNKNMKRCRVSWPRNPTWVWKFGLEMKHRKIVNRAVNLVGFIVMNFLSYPSTFLLQSPSPSGSSCNMKYAWMLEDSLPKLVLSFHHCFLKIEFFRGSGLATSVCTYWSTLTVSSFMFMGAKL